MIEQSFLQELQLDLDLESSQRLSGGDTAQAYRVESSGGPLFVKVTERPKPGMFTAEAAGLGWLSDAGLTAPAVLGVTESALVLEWLQPHPASPSAAIQFGRELAAMHSQPVEAFGVAPQPLQNSQRFGWVGDVRFDYGHWQDWRDFYAEAWLLPIGELAHRTRGLSQSGLTAVTQLAELLVREGIDIGPPTEPVRIHGDLWSGNLLWQTHTASIIDPAAHGGHPETDLAMLQLFSPSNLASILRGYQQIRPLDDNWQQRTHLHQLLPLLVHTVMFGSSYGEQVERTANQILATAR